MKDAQLIFRYQPAIKQQFVFSNLVSVYENKNVARKKELLITAANKPLQHAIITSEDVIKGSVELIDRMKNVA